VSDSLREFRAEEWVFIPKRGPLAVIERARENDDLPDPGVLVGQDVLIDGEQCRVIGVEMFAVPRWARYKHPFGLLVERD
jgi:hypothetical protein